MPQELPASGEQPQQLEPAMDHMKEDQKEKASRDELLVHPEGCPFRNLASSFPFIGRQRQALLRPTPFRRIVEIPLECR